MEEVRIRCSPVLNLVKPLLQVYIFFNLGAFLVPYLVLAVTSAIPLFLLESAVGQYTQEGSITCWRKLCPIAEGGTSYIIQLKKSRILSVETTEKEEDCKVVIHYPFYQH